jgi:hypothetical protein
MTFGVTAETPQEPTAERRGAERRAARRSNLHSSGAGRHGQCGRELVRRSSPANQQLLALRRDLLTPETRKRSALKRCATTPRSASPRTGTREHSCRSAQQRHANENYYTCTTLLPALARRQDAGAVAHRLPPPGRRYRCEPDDARAAAAQLWQFHGDDMR